MKLGTLYSETGRVSLVVDDKRIVRATYTGDGWLVEKCEDGETFAEVRIKEKLSGALRLVAETAEQMLNPRPNADDLIASLRHEDRMRIKAELYKGRQVKVTETCELKYLRGESGRVVGLVDFDHAEVQFDGIGLYKHVPTSELRFVE